MWRKVLLVAAGVVCLCSGFPAIRNRDAEEAGYFEGDMILNANQLEGRLFPAISRNGLIDTKYRWPGKHVHYNISPDFDDDHRKHILKGLALIEAATCIRFFPANETTKEYVNVTAQNGGCFSSVGFQNRVQTLNLQVYPLDTGCFRLGTIVHEFIHALGFYHQQSTYDRDEFVTIVHENIVETSIHNFNIYNETVVEDFGITYDYGSVMHYSSLAFSKNGQQTIVPKDPNAVIGQRLGMSVKDVQKLNIMYRCPILA